MDNFNDLLGKTLTNIENIDDVELIFTTDKGDKYKLYHAQSCCETVEIEDICGDLDDLIKSPILLAEEVNNEQYVTPEGCTEKKAESFTWTFYNLATLKGYVTIRWCGESNGFYSESVFFIKEA